MQQLTTHENDKAIPEGTFHNLPMYIQVKDHLLNRIKLGEWKAEQILPNEADLAKKYRCSSGTMRKALDLLEADGFLTRIQGRGTFVNDKKAADDKRMLACLMAADVIVKKAIEEGGSGIPTRAQAALRVEISEALFMAGYVGEPDDE